MVTISHSSLAESSGALLLAEQQSQSLPEPVKQIALMALLGIALLGMLLVVGILLGGHWVRRLGSYVRRPAVPPDVIVPRRQSPSSPKLPSGDVEPGDTIGSDETIA